MKKAILSAAVAFFAITVANAQTEFGIKGGLNASTLSIEGSNSSKVKSLFGANGGFFASIPASKNFFVQPELAFSMEGARFENAAGGTTEQRINLINLPIMFKYVTNSGFFVEAGPQVGLIISAKQKTGSVETNFEDNINSANLAAGGGVGFKLGEALGVGARYMFGVRNVSKIGGARTNINNASLNLFYTFGR